MKMLPELESALYRGQVRHRRFTPKQHEFQYPIFMVWLKLDEVDQLVDRLWLLGTRPWHWARFRRQDYVGETSSSLDDSVRQTMARLGNLSLEQLTGDVFMLGHLRYLGLYFSPLNLYFLRQDKVMRYMLAEVSNTPWNERHYYLVDLANPQAHNKQFHVSPFNPMSQSYRWYIKPPGEHNKSIVHLQVNASDDSSQKVFDATLKLSRVSLIQSQLFRVLAITPVQTASMIAGIYWQALKLYCKGVPLHPHPASGSGKLKRDDPTVK